MSGRSATNAGVQFANPARVRLWYALLQAFTATRRAWGWWVLYTLVTAAACYAQLSTIFIIFAQFVAVCILYFFRAKSLCANAYRQIWWVLGSLVVIGLFITPIAIVSRGGSKTAWLPQPSALDLPRTLRGLHLQQERLPFVIGVGLCALGGLLLLWMWYRGRSRQEERKLDSIIQPLIGAEVVFVIALLCWAILPGSGKLGCISGSDARLLYSLSGNHRACAVPAVWPRRIGDRIVPAEPS